MPSSSEDSAFLPSDFIIAELAESDDNSLLRALFQENQALNEQIARQNQLMHLLTHQLATPLTSLRGSIQLLSEPGLTTEQRREFLAVVHQQIQRLRELFQDLTALRDLETGALNRHPKPLSLLELVDEVMVAFASYPVQYAFSPGLPLVWSDRWQISQVLVNLISNAIKYSPDGKLIEIGARPQSEDWIEVWVQDHGLGIPEVDQPHLFERFYRVKHRDRQNIEGTGLGLSLCKLLVENQGGQIHFTSAHGHGSCFYFTVPVARATNNHDLRQGA